MAVFDEAQALKNADTRRARASRQIPAAFRVALTGTPIENRLEDLWSLFNLINPGLLGTRQSFQKRFAAASAPSTEENAVSEGQSAARQAPVSYTHLDVYKRQVLSCPTGCMNFGEREDMENLAEQRLAEVKERFPNAVLGDNGIVHVIYLYAEDPNLYHKFAVFAQNDANPMTRRQLFAKLRRPVA